MADKVELVELNEKTLRSILHQAIKQKSHFPVCTRRRESTVASGSAVAGISLQMIHNSLTSLQNQVEVTCFNLIKENHFEIEHLEDYVKKFNVLWFDFNWIIGRRHPSSRGVQIINSIAVVFSKLPKKEIKEIQILFDNIYKLFEYSYDRMSGIVMNLRAEKTENALESVVRIEIASKFALIYRSIENVLKKIDSTHKGIRASWSNSVNTIKEDSFCDKKQLG